MVQWEYHFIAIEFARGNMRTPGEWRVRYINGQGQNDWEKGPSMFEYCAARGAEGWEMVAVSNAPLFNGQGKLTEEYYRIIFKRPIGGTNTPTAIP